jgi:hypothetical protein
VRLSTRVGYHDLGALSRDNVSLAQLTDVGHSGRGGQGPASEVQARFAPRLRAGPWAKAEPGCHPDNSRVHFRRGASRGALTGIVPARVEVNIYRGDAARGLDELSVGAWGVNCGGGSRTAPTNRLGRRGPGPRATWPAIVRGATGALEWSPWRAKLPLCCLCKQSGGADAYWGLGSEPREPAARLIQGLPESLLRSP